MSYPMKVPQHPTRTKALGPEGLPSEWTPLFLEESQQVAAELGTAAGLHRGLLIFCTVAINSGVSEIQRWLPGWVGPVPLVLGYLE